MRKDDAVLKELKTQENRLKYIEAILSGITPEGFLPRRVFIEPTNYCNFKCRHCPTAKEMTRKKGFMDIALYRQVIDELAPYWPYITVNLYMHGEPLLHPQIYEMIDYAQEKQLFVQLNTNLGVLKKRDIANLLRLNYLGVSLDAASSQTYSRIKGKDQFDRVLTLFLDFLEAWGVSAGPETFACDAVFLRQRRNRHEAELFSEMFSRLPIGHVAIYDLHNFTGPFIEGNR